jgi:ribulose-5-phosphate 4-epimerase/fuculose-1-phosphate aldolase
MRFAHISYHDYDGVVLDTAAREELVKSLGSNNAMILRNHGLLTTGATIPEAFNAMHRLELSCRTQVAAMSCNTRLVDVPSQVVEATYNMYQPKTRRPFGLLDWPALLRKLDRIDPSFRD